MKQHDREAIEEIAEREGISFDEAAERYFGTPDAMTPLHRRGRRNRGVPAWKSAGPQPEDLEDFGPIGGDE